MVLVYSLGTERKLNLPDEYEIAPSWYEENQKDEIDQDDAYNDNNNIRFYFIARYVAPKIDIFVFSLF